MKKIFIIFTVIISIFIIYFITLDRKVYYLALGDGITTSNLENNSSYSNYVESYLSNYDKLEAYINEFSKENYRITDIINDIDNNKNIKIGNSNKTLKNALIKSDLLTISVGMNDLTSKININSINSNINYQQLYDNVDEITNDLESLFVLLRSYCKEKIFLIGVYYPYQNKNQELSKVFSYFNTKFKEMSLVHNIEYIDIYDIFLENQTYLSETTIYPSEIGQEVISNQIIATINNTILKNSWFYEKRLL